MASAADNDPEQLDALIRLYWAPLKIYLMASFPTLRDRAEELLQNFSEDRILRDGWLGRADRGRGRFRDFLKRSLYNFVLDHLSKAEVKHAPLSLDVVNEEVAGPESAAEQFDLMWVRTVLAEALQQMETDCRNPSANQPHRSNVWEIFRARLLDPIFNEAVPVPYEQLIERFELKSPTEAFNMLLSAKRIFKAHLARVVAGYAGADRATAAEVEALNSFIQGLGRKC